MSEYWWLLLVFLALMWWNLERRLDHALKLLVQIIDKQEGRDD